MEHYKVPDFHTALEFLSLLARRQGKLRKGGLPDTDKAAKCVLMDWTGWGNEIWWMFGKYDDGVLTFSWYLVAGSAISRTLQRHTPSPRTSALKSSRRWVKPLTGMSWKRGIRKFLQVGKAWTGCPDKPNLTVGSNIQMLTQLRFRVILSWYSNGILHGNYWNDRKQWTCCPGNGGNIPGRPRNQRWNWIYGWWTGPWGGKMHNSCLFQSEWLWTWNQSYTVTHCAFLFLQ